MSLERETAYSLSNDFYHSAPEQLTEVRVIADSISVNGDLLSFKGKYDGQVYQLYYTLQSQEEQEFFQKNSQILTLKIEGMVEEATSQRNFGGFDYQTYLKREGIYRVVNIDKITDYHMVHPISPIEYLQLWRRQAIVHIQTNFPNPMKHYMTGLLFGYLDKSFEDMSDIYSSLGIIHLFALSGMKVGFFLRIFRYLFLRMGCRTDQVAWLQLPFSLVYAGLTGFSVSVIRSLLQALLKNLGIKGLDNLALTLIILFISMPNFLLTTGGVLTFIFAFILNFSNVSGLHPIKAFFAQHLFVSLGTMPISFCPQNQAIDWYLNVFDNVYMEALFDGSIDAKEKTIDVLKQIGLEGKEKEDPTNLSGGQLQRIQLARQLVSNAKILILDEPTSSLDVITSEKILDQLKDKTQGVKTCLISSHDLDMLEKYCNKVLYIENGELLFFGSMDSFIEQYNRLCYI